MKQALALVLCAFLCGCASSVVPMGKDTFMVEHGGWPHMDVYAMETKCLKDANKFCEKRGLAMVPVSTSERAGVIFANNADFKLIFKAVPKGSPEDVPPNMIRSPDSVKVNVNINKEVK